MGKFTRNRVDRPEYAKKWNNKKFATYFRRVVLTYMESESSFLQMLGHRDRSEELEMVLRISWVSVLLSHRKQGHDIALVNWKNLCYDQCYIYPPPKSRAEGPFPPNVSPNIEPKP